MDTCPACGVPLGNSNLFQHIATRYGIEVPLRGPRGSAEAKEWGKAHYRVLRKARLHLGMTLVEAYRR